VGDRIRVIGERIANIGREPLDKPEVVFDAISRWKQRSEIPRFPNGPRLRIL
jgi:hypothetical protein